MFVYILFCKYEIADKNFLSTVKKLKPVYMPASKFACMAGALLSLTENTSAKLLYYNPSEYNVLCNQQK